jgi:hypothetical protein
VTDVRSESINGIEVLAVGSTGTLGRGEEVGTKGDVEKLIVEALLEDHGTGVSQTDSTVAVWIEGIEGRYFTRFVHYGCRETQCCSLGID